MELDLNKISNLEFDVDTSDFPDFCDAFLVAGDYDGRELTEKEIEYLNDNHSDFINERVYEFTTM